ncbi:MAG: TonB-dependent receptor [Azonexus sp.]|nr:TonB-dependent receptor [Azonexus sp.]
MKAKFWLSLPWVALSLGASFNGGALAADEDIYFSELPVVASVSRLPQRLADAPTAVTVIDRDMIKASGARDLNDVFRLVPGFQTYPNNTEPAKVTYHGMGDGDYSSRVQVLIDGRSMYSPLFDGGVNWATLPVALEDIERIEVVRGTNAVSYGSNAFLGVINIITVDPALVRGVSVSTSYGNQNVRDYSLRTGGRIGDVGDFRFTFKQQNDDGLANKYDWIDSYFSRLFDFRADFALSERDSLQFSLGKVDGITQAGRLYADELFGQSTNPIRDVRQTNTYAQFVWRRVLSPASDVQIRYSYMTDRSSDAFNVVIPILPPGQQVIHVNQTGDEGARHEIELQHSLKLAAATRLVWGASWRDDSVRSAWTFPGQGTVHREISRLFGNIEWKPTHWFTGNLGLAGENDSMAGSHASPRVSTNFHLNQENTIRLGYSRANRTPSTANFRGDQKTPFEQLYSGVRDLPSERLDTLEIGYLGDWREQRASLDMRLFSEKIYNRLFRIDMSFDGDPSTQGDSTIPIQDVSIKGLEYQFKWQPFDSTRVLVNQTFSKIDSEFLPGKQAIINNWWRVLTFTEASMPRRSTSMLLMQKLPYGMEFSTAVYWQDYMKWSGITWSEKYYRVDARLAYPFRAGSLGGEIALMVQSLNGSHNEYKSHHSPANRVVDRRQWITLRLDF